MKNEALKRPNIENYCSDASLSDMHSTYVSNPAIWEYLQALDAYCDELEKLQSVGKSVADTAGTCSLQNFSASCVTCHYSSKGKHGCNRLMDYAEPKIDKTKGVECARNGYVHYLPFDSVGVSFRAKDMENFAAYMLIQHNGGNKLKTYEHLKEWLAKER